MFLKQENGGIHATLYAQKFLLNRCSADSVDRKLRFSHYFEQQITQVCAETRLLLQRCIEEILIALFCVSGIFRAVSGFVVGVFKGVSGVRINLDVSGLAELL